jgi:hypothetical protein
MAVAGVSLVGCFSWKFEVRSEGKVLCVFSFVRRGWEFVYSKR